MSKSISGSAHRVGVHLIHLKCVFSATIDEQILDALFVPGGYICKFSQQFVNLDLFDIFVLCEIIQKVLLFGEND